jgi:hypothetical protein
MVASQPGITTLGGVLHALVEQRVQFGDYALAFLVVGGLWLDHHQLLDPMQNPWPAAGQDQSVVLVDGVVAALLGWRSVSPQGQRRGWPAWSTYT